MSKQVTDQTKTSGQQQKKDSEHRREEDRRQQEIVDWYFQRAEIVQRGTENYYNVTNKSVPSKRGESPSFAS